ncbi:MAG: hypothetical protein QM582_14675 [Micropruina sp.]|uniref:hypothetical protein n=1 Tax=Micropruina sp. TaxID=2737536 RepID=UPI0039E2C91E
MSDPTMPADPQHLDAASVRATVVRLDHRIRTRFPTRNLRFLPGQLIQVIDHLQQRQDAWRIRRRWLTLSCRLLIAVAVAGLLAALAVIVSQSAPGAGPSGWDWLSVFESLVNDAIFAGVAIYFLWALPERLQRHGDLATLQRLRSLAHVVDMHQLTKDPERLRPDFHTTTATVPLRMTSIELANYLDYCSELLSMVGKTAALFGEDTDDRTTLSTIAGIEDLTNQLSVKIWTKISLLPSAVRRAGAPPTAPSPL